MNPMFGAGWARPGRPRRGFTPWAVDRETRIRLLEEHQRNLEQRAADVADRISDLRRSSGVGTRREPRQARRGPAWGPVAAPGGRHGRSAGAPGAPGASAREVDVGDGRRLTVRELDGPPGTATLVLLHGWGGTAAGNWSVAMPALARRYHVVAPDLPGHDQAAVDDVAALIERLGRGGVIAVGYSLGSSVAWRLASQHPELVDGVVLCAAAGVAPLVADASRGGPADGSEVPVAVVVTEHDRLIPAGRQHELARALPGATVHRVDGNHFAFARYALFVPALLEACASVAERSMSGGTVV